MEINSLESLFHVILRSLRRKRLKAMGAHIQAPAVQTRSDAIMSVKKWPSQQEQLKEELPYLLHPPRLGPLQINPPPLSPEVLGLSRGPTL